jgi:lipid-A-disaccharide synthase-like uncharacterized protein
MRFLRHAILILVLLTAMGTARAADQALQGPVVPLNLKLDGVRNNVSIGRLQSGTLVYIVGDPSSGNARLLTPEAFAEAYYGQQASRQGWLPAVFNVTTPLGFAWVLLGLGGQALFSGRMLVQWFASEKSKRSVIPVSFWWMSIIGATMLLLYFVWRRDIVGILGQATGWIIYVRNLVLIRRSRH